jgi:hypothetical protein
MLMGTLSIITSRDFAQISFQAIGGDREDIKEWQGY